MTTQTYLIDITPTQAAQTARTLAALCDLAQQATDIETIAALALAARFALAIQQARPVRVIDDDELTALHAAQDDWPAIAQRCVACGSPLDDCPHSTCDACAATGL